MGLLGAIGTAAKIAAWEGTKAVVGTAAKGAYQVGKATAGGIGTVAYYGGKAALKGTATVAGGVAKGTAAIVKDAYAARNEEGARNAVGQFVHMGKAMVKGMGDWEKAKDVYNPLTGQLKHTDAHFKLGTFGKVALFGPALAAGVVGGAQKYEDNRVGPVDSNVVTATPNYAPAKTPSYANNCGATGDLVFALHNNRFG